MKYLVAIVWFVLKHGAVLNSVLGVWTAIMLVNGSWFAGLAIASMIIVAQAIWLVTTFKVREVVVEHVATATKLGQDARVHEVMLFAGNDEYFYSSDFFPPRAPRVGDRVIVFCLKVGPLKNGPWSRHFMQGWVKLASA